MKRSRETQDAPACFRRRAFLEIRDPWNAQNQIRADLRGAATSEETSS